MGDLLANKLWSVFKIFWGLEKVTVEITNMSLNFTLWRTSAYGLISSNDCLSRGAETLPYVSLPALFVANRTFRKSKIVNCCFRILQCFHWISDEFNDIVVNFSKRVFRDCKMFLLTFKPLTSKNRRFLRFV